MNFCSEFFTIKIAGFLSRYQENPNVDFFPNADKEEQSDAIEDKINDLINMFVIHLKGNYDHNLCQAVLISLVNFKKDITQNNRIRNRILLPYSQAILTE